MKCPHCKTKLVPFTLDLLQCPSDWTVHEKKQRKAKKLIEKVMTENAPTFQALADADESLAKLACPVKGCD
jgi:hypothetical protein